MYKRKKKTMKEIREFANSKKYYNNTLFNLKVDTSGIPKAGLGVYTLDFIPTDCIIGEYEGQLLENYDCTNDPYYYEIRQAEPENSISSLGISCLKLPRCYMGMINDATDYLEYTNNCEFELEINEEDIKQSKVYIISTCDIEPEEELFVSYGEDYWKSK